MNVRDYIEHLKGKPAHTRQQIAYSAAGALSLVVALGWMTALVSSGTLAFDDSEAAANFSQATGALTEETRNVAGAAAAFDISDVGKGSITVVEDSASSTLDKEDTGEATAIPF